MLINDQGDSNIYSVVISKLSDLQGDKKGILVFILYMQGTFEKKIKEKYIFGSSTT